MTKHRKASHSSLVFHSVIVFPSFPSHLNQFYAFAFSSNIKKYQSWHYFNLQRVYFKIFWSKAWINKKKNRFHLFSNSKAQIIFCCYQCSGEEQFITTLAMSGVQWRETKGWKLCEFFHHKPTDCHFKLILINELSTKIHPKIIEQATNAFAFLHFKNYYWWVFDIQHQARKSNEKTCRVRLSKAFIEVQSSKIKPTKGRSRSRER